jgi:Tol biopolymer transport system component
MTDRLKVTRLIAMLSVAALTLAAAGAPVAPALFEPGRISTGDMELNAAFTPDGKTLYFTKRSPKPQLWVIVASHLRRGGWRAPEVAEFSGQYSDFDPFVSPDGKRLYFSSNRPIDGAGRPKSDFDIWFVERTASGWGPPQRLDAPVNTAAQEFYPSVTADGTLYFSSNRDGGAGAGDIYRARLVDGRYAEPENLGDSINARTSEGDPYVSPDERYLLFVSYNRAGGRGDGDLYISVRRDGVWSKAENLGPEINSPALEFCPIVSPDGKWLYFTSERGFADVPQTRRLTSAELARRLREPGNGLGDIYRVEASAILSRYIGR